MIFEGPRGEPYGQYVRALLDAWEVVPPLEVPLSGLKKRLVQALLYPASGSRCKIAQAIAKMQDISGKSHIVFEYPENSSTTKGLTVLKN
jgi:hypothetical protein